MTCRHSRGDPACSSTSDGWRAVEIEQERYEAEKNRIKKAEAELYARTPDADKYEIVEAAKVGNHLVLKVLYPNCSKCSYEGNKVVVFLNTSELDALKWKRIDPHFRDPKTARLKKEAPPPAARFPASSEGWADAVAYAKSKS